MAIVQPFQAWRFNLKKGIRAVDVIVPPYDVISPAELKKLQQRKFNFSQIILNEAPDKYTQAAHHFSEWVRQEVLIQDEKPALYFYKQEFTLSPLELFCQKVSPAVKRGAPLTRYGFFAAVGLEEYAAKVILPHEKTFSAHKDDRYKLMTACQGNMEPVFLGYDSADFSGEAWQAAVGGNEPLLKYVDSAGVRHELHSTADRGIVESVQNAILEKQLFILDGHHRYETALKYYLDHRNTDGMFAHRFVLADVCAFQQEGVVILPTHRALKKIALARATDIAKQLEEFFEFRLCSNLEEVEEPLMSHALPSFGLIFDAQKEQAPFGVLLGKSGLRELQLNTGSSRQYENLDLIVLHEYVLKQLGAAEEDIEYIKDINELRLGAQTGQWKAGFLVRPNTYQDVVGVARRAEKMPHKSTFFYPKIPSGLVIRTF